MQTWLTNILKAVENLQGMLTDINYVKLLKVPSCVCVILNKIPHNLVPHILLQFSLVVPLMLNKFYCKHYSWSWVKICFSLIPAMDICNFQKFGTCNFLVLVSQKFWLSETQYYIQIMVKVVFNLIPLTFLTCAPLFYMINLKNDKALSVWQILQNFIVALKNYHKTYR